MTEKEILLSSILNCPRSSLYSGGLFLSAKVLKKLSRCLSLRSEGFPLQYILGEVEFFGLIFKLDKRVFIPRPETEILVETAINSAASLRPSVCGQIKILDIGTGSGCIAVALAKNLAKARIIAIDISREALEIARQNARLNGAEERIHFIQSDLLSALPHPLSAYDLLISNPPYIRSQDIEHLQKELKYEPRIALDGGCSGLDFYRRIIRQAPRLLKKDGLLLMEIGFGQYDKIKNIFEKTGNFKIIDLVKDYNKIERVIIGQRIAKKYG
ncbi:MAG: protein-(glutamine-N5) methyltransferase, release factor-specific [Omnitrophica WOR_2 bacterium RIFCSPHIGHO2_02_FULL_45_21]|nr:MAG: protein-(glutamine-N5) methyltransferase, release factor-specific [Omnitrophica WOR_2 bacterium RIFCSPHIGHO2_02_FULL_45_21]